MNFGVLSRSDLWMNLSQAWKIFVFLNPGHIQFSGDESGYIDVHELLT